MTGKPLTIQLWEQDGMWEWDIRWPGPPQTRSTGRRPTLREAMAAVTEWVVT